MFSSFGTGLNLIDNHLRFPISALVLLDLLDEVLLKILTGYPDEVINFHKTSQSFVFGNVAHQSIPLFGLFKINFQRSFVRPSASN